jgi:hypothetical protein
MGIERHPMPMQRPVATAANRLSHSIGRARNATRMTHKVHSLIANSAAPLQSSRLRTGYVVTAHLIVRHDAGPPRCPMQPTQLHLALWHCRRRSGEMNASRAERRSEQAPNRIADEFDLDYNELDQRMEAACRGTAGAHSFGSSASDPA